MKTVIEIDTNSQQAKQLLKFIKTLPFAKIRESGADSDKWDEAIAAGAVSVDAFIAEAKRQIKEHYNNA